MSFLPSPTLQPYVESYWLAINKNAQQYAVLPDGAVDVVIQSNESTAKSSVFGTTTECTDIDLEINNNYLGIRFKPGQSRHFITLAAKDLTNDVISANDILDFSLEELSEGLPKHGIAQRLNRILENHLKKKQPETTQLDKVIAIIEDSQGIIRIDEATVYSGKSRRQFERIFKETVGISPKFFSIITRFNHASALITKLSQTKLAEIAVEAGYSDQSHMTHEFKRMTGVTPNEFMHNFNLTSSNHKSKKRK